MGLTPRPLPRDGRVDVWLLDGPDPSPDAWDTVGLAPEEAARADRMATAELRERARRRRRFLRRVLSSYLGLRPEAVPLGEAPGGKPVLPAETGLHFSLSHSGDLSVLAVADAEIGIDVERRKSFDRLCDVVAFACSPRERMEIHAAPDATAAFLERWVVKEAILKCRGTGLVEDLGGVDPGPVSQAPKRWRDLTVAALRPPRDLAPNEALHVALAARGPADRIVWSRLGAGSSL